MSHTSRTRRRALASLAFAVTAVTLFAAHPAVRAASTYDWKASPGGLSGTFPDPEHWNRIAGATGTFPIGGDSAIFQQPATFTVTISTATNAGDVSVLAGSVTLASSGGQKGITLTSGTNPHLGIAGSQLSLGNTGNAVTVTTTAVTIRTGGMLSVLYGSDLVGGSLMMADAADPSPSSLLLDGASSTMNISGAFSAGTQGGDAVVGLSNNAVGSIGGTSTIGDATGHVSVSLATNSTLTAGNMTVAAGSSMSLASFSTFTLSGASTFTTSAPVAVASSTFTTSTGLATFKAGSSLSLTGASTFNVMGDLALDGAGATLPAASLKWAAGKAMNLSSAGSLALTGPYTTPVNSVFHLVGASLSTSAVQSGDDATLTLGAGSSIDAIAGSTLAVSSLAMSSSGTSALVVDGPTSLLSATGSSFSSFVGTGSGAATLTVRNGASATFDNVLFVGASGAATSGALNIQSGATVLVHDLDLATGATGTSTASVSVTGAASTLLLSGDITAGNPQTTTTTITVGPGAAVVQGDTSLTPIGAATGSGSTTLSRGSTLNVVGGSAFLGALFADAATINFTSGALGFVGNLTVDTGGPLGYQINLNPLQSLALTGTTTLNVGSSVTLAGGALSTGAIVNNGTLNFGSGTIALTGAGGLTLASTEALGASVNLPAGKRLIVSHTVTLPATASLSVTGGSLTADTMSNAGSVTVNNYGVVTIDSGLTNAVTGRLFLGPDVSVTVDGASTNLGRITLQGGSTRLVGSGTMTNTGLITGSGEVAKALVNPAGGELRGEAGKSLLLSGPATSNGGKINLQGGTVEFSGPLNNAVGGTISGRGILIASGGLVNDGLTSFSGGLADVFGVVTNNNRILVTGGSTSTFYDAFTNSAVADVFTAAESSVVFLGDVTGSGTFSGTGTKYFSDGSSTVGALETQGVTVVSEPAAVTVGEMAEAAVTVNGALTVGESAHVGMLAIGPAGTVDLGDATLVVGSGVMGYLRSGQLTSSVADPMDVKSIGYIQSGAETLVKLTATGDANMNGRVDPDDYALLDRGMGKHLTSWGDGDFNYDGVVNSKDYLLIDRVYVMNGGADAGWVVAREARFGEEYVGALMASVPEPSIAGVVVTAVAISGRRRGRRW